MALAFIGKKKENLALGIDIGTKNIKLVELKPQEEGYRLIKLALQPLPSDAVPQRGNMDFAKVAEALKLLINSQRVKRKKVATSVAGHAVIVKRLILPPMSRKELEQNLEAEAKRYLPDVQELSLDFQIISQGQDGTEVLLVAARKEMITNYITLLEAVDLEPAVIDADAFALQNAFEANYPHEREQTIALCDIGASVTTINVVKNGECLFTRDVALGGNFYTEELQKELGLSHEEAELLKFRASEEESPRVMRVMTRVSRLITLEISKSLDFFSASYPDNIRKIYLTGGTSKVPGLADILKERTGIEVEPLNPFNNIMVNVSDFPTDYLREMAPFCAVAVGLAMRRV